MIGVPKGWNVFDVRNGIETPHPVMKTQKTYCQIFFLPGGVTVKEMCEKWDSNLTPFLFILFNAHRNGKRDLVSGVSMTTASRD